MVVLVTVEKAAVVEVALFVELTLVLWFLWRDGVDGLGDDDEDDDDEEEEEDHTDKEQEKEEEDDLSEEGECVEGVCPMMGSLGLPGTPRPFLFSCAGFLAVADPFLRGGEKSRSSGRLLLTHDEQEDEEEEDVGFVKEEECLVFKALVAEEE